MADYPHYETIEMALEQAKITANAAEAHGMMCGFICAGVRMDGKSWLLPILGQRKLPLKQQKELRELLLNLYKVSSEKLQAMEFDFQLLLPEDDASLDLRAKALSVWCQGFIIAQEQAGLQSTSYINQDAREGIHNMLEISQLDYENIHISEEDERAYIDVMEYVRMAVLMIYNEINNSPTTVMGSESKCLH